MPPGDLDMFLPDGMLMSGTTVQAAAERQVGCPINMFLLGTTSITSCEIIALQVLVLMTTSRGNLLQVLVLMTTSRGNLLKSYVPDDASK